MADTDKTSSMLLDEPGRPRPPPRREVVKELRKVAEAFAAVPDGRHTAQTL